MNYEKEYKEALERAKTLYENANGIILKKWVEQVFPELKDSEDERIRKNLITCISTFKHPLFSEIERKEFLAWLEKQGEQKINLVEILKHYPKETELYSPLYGKLWLAEVDEENEIITCYKHPLNKGCTRAILEQEDTVSFYSDGTIGLPDFSVSKDCMLFLYDIEQGKSALEAIKEEKVDNANKVEPKFKVGDWITNGATKPAQISSIEDDMYYTHNGTIGGDIESMDKDYHLWTIEDAKIGDILVYKGNVKYSNGVKYERICLFNNLNNAFFTLTKTSNYVEEYDINVNIDYPDNTVPATKEQTEILFMAIADAGYTFDFDKKEGRLSRSLHKKQNNNN